MTANTPTPSVLFVDDDEAMRSSIQELFVELGWQYQIVCDGLDALKATDLKKFDIVITDYQMPGMGGLELLKKLREKDPRQGIIIVTGVCSPTEAAELVKSGVNDFIEKPITLGSLERSVERLLAVLQDSKEDDRMSRSMVEFTCRYDLSTKEAASQRPNLRILDHLCDAGKLDNKIKQRIQLAFQEAFTNSLEHGNLELDSKWKNSIDHQGRDKFTALRKERLTEDKFASRRIYVDTSFEGGELIIEIKDQGPGFVQGDVEVTRNSEIDALNFYGRGIKLMTAIMDLVHYTDDGTRVVMSKTLIPPTQK